VEDIASANSPATCRHIDSSAVNGAYEDPRRRLSKRKKGEPDLIRLAEAHPELKQLYPAVLQQQPDRG